MLFGVNLEKGMFLGEYTQKMDAKGRVVVPFKFRDELGSHVIVTRGEKGRCLYAFSKDGFEEEYQKIRKLSMLKKKNKQFNRFFLAGAKNLEADKLGRVSLTTALRDFALLDKEVVWVGVGDRIEIWDVDKWSAELERLTDDSLEDSIDIDALFEEIAEEEGI